MRTTQVAGAEPELQQQPRWLLSLPQVEALDDYLKFNCSPLGVINMYAMQEREREDLAADRSAELAKSANWQKMRRT